MQENVGVLVGNECKFQKMFEKQFGVLRNDCVDPDLCDS